MNEKEMAAKIHAAVWDVARLMNEARLMGLTVSFSIIDSEDMRTEPPSKIFIPAITITKEIKP